MAYMSRLGLWGKGTAFGDFKAFLDTMKKRGVSFLELLAMEAKSNGYYVARSLSFRCACGRVAGPVPAPAVLAGSEQILSLHAHCLSVPPLPALLHGSMRMGRADAGRAEMLRAVLQGRRVHRAGVPADRRADSHLRRRRAAVAGVPCLPWLQHRTCRGESFRPPV